MVMTLMSNPKGTVATVIVSQAGDGDTTDIQTGIDMLPAGGGVVYIKEGTYQITLSLTITSNNVALIGAGRATIIENLGEITSLTSINYIGLLINKIYFRGSGVDDLNNRGIYFSGCDNSTISECWFTHYRFAGIHILTSDYVTISTCNFNNTIGRGLYIDTTTFGSFINNTANDDGYSGYEFISSTDCVLLGNVAFSNASYGIILNGSSRNTITGNVCYDNGGAFDGIGIFADSNYNVISSNVCHSNNRYGINIDNANCDENIILGNHCLGNTTGQIRDVGTGTELAHNITT